MEKEAAKKKKAADDAAKKAAEAAAAAEKEKAAAAAKGDLAAKIKAGVKSEVTKIKSDILKANAALQDEIDTAKAEHMQKIIDAEQQCKDQNRNTIQESEDAHAASLKSR
jgi:hypothetical protein